MRWHRALGQTNKWRQRMHLRRLSTGAVHPSAPTPGSLTYMYNENINPLSFRVSFQISGRHLGVLFVSGGEEESELVIWDWTTGHVHLVSTVHMNWLSNTHLPV
jgi:hypothetical protein